MINTEILQDIITDHDLCAVQERELLKVIAMIKQNRLIELPCAVGDTVYEVQEIRKRIQEYIIISVEYSYCDTTFRWNVKSGEGIYSNLNGFKESDIGKKVFLTKEEAERKLKELEG